MLFSYKIENKYYTRRTVPTIVVTEETSISNILSTISEYTKKPMHLMTYFPLSLPRLLQELTAHMSTTAGVL